MDPIYRGTTEQDEQGGYALTRKDHEGLPGPLQGLCVADFMSCYQGLS